MVNAGSLMAAIVRHPFSVDGPLRIEGQRQTQQSAHILSNPVNLGNGNEGLNLKTRLGFKE
jgi:hypothetical protein